MIQNPDVTLRILSAAIRFADGRVFRGAIHALAMLEAIEAGAIVVHDEQLVGSWEDGFVTSSGEFLDRAAALTVASASGQYEASRDERTLDAERMVAYNRLQADVAA